MNGIICINKPTDFTSFDVVAKLRGILKTKKLGHAGTLDPMATGVLPIFVGNATKACDILPNSDKSYCAGFKLGITTDTQDCTGKTLIERLPTGINSDKIEEALKSFRGDIMQIPPMFSAVSIGGQRLYDLARKGIEVEREARPITIFKLELLDYDEINFCGRLEISCSKGTYIRTIINDLGEALGCGGIMTSLVRTTAAGFNLSDCVTFEDLIGMNGDFSAILLPIEKVFSDLPKIQLNDVQTKMYKNGIKLDSNRIEFEDCGARYSVYSTTEFLGTAYIDREKNELRIEKNFYDR